MALGAEGKKLSGRNVDPIQRKLLEFGEQRELGTPTEIEARLTIPKGEIDVLLTSLITQGLRGKPSASIVLGERIRKAPRSDYTVESRLMVGDIPFPPWGRPLPAKAKVTRHCVRKTVIGRTIQVHGLKLWRLAVATEAPCEKFKPVNDVFVRVKSRVSFTLPGRPNWRLDITLTWRGESYTEFGRVVQIQESYINPLIKAAAQPDGWQRFLRVFRGQLARSQVTAEVELEWVGKTNPVMADIAVVDEVLQRVVVRDDNSAAFAQIMQRLGEAIYPTNPSNAAFRIRRGLKGLLPQVRALSLGAFVELGGGRPLGGWLVGAKTEGFHGVVMCGHIVEVAYEAAKKYVWRPGCEQRANRKLTVLECEVLRGDADAVTVYAFDVLYVDGVSLVGKTPLERSQRLDDAVALVQGVCGGQTSWLVAKKPAVLPAVTGTGRAAEAAIERVIKQLLGTEAFPTDGLVFTDPKAAPFPSTVSYKWKPREKNTIDFWLISVPDAAWRDEFNPRNVPGLPETDGQFAGTVYALFVTVNLQVFHSRRLALPPNASLIYPPEEFHMAQRGLSAGGNINFKLRTSTPFPVLFTPPDYPTAHVFAVPRGQPGGAGEYHRKVCEMRPEFTDAHAPGGAPVERWAPGQLLNVNWDMVTVREDRSGIEGYYGNFLTVAEESWYNNLTPFPAHALWGDLPEDVYFQARKDAMYAAPLAFNSSVKAWLYTHIGNATTFVELAAGRGADLRRIYHLHPERVLFVDQDAGALMLLYQRVRSRAEKERDAGAHVSLALADLTQPSDDLVQFVREQLAFPAANALSCQFALHYFCRSVDSLRNFAKACNGLANRQEATLIFTYPDGAKIFAALSQLPEKTLEFREDGAVKYMFQGLWRGKKFENVGQMVKVKLPFRDELTEEPLVNHEYFAGVMKRAGFALIDSGLFSKRLNAFAQQNVSMAQGLTADDKTYVGDFFRYAIFRRE
jgi:hypothetical protein